MELHNEWGARPPWQDHRGEQIRGRTDSPALAWLLERLEQEQESVARIITAAGRDEVRDYASLAGPDQFEEVVADTRQHLQTFARYAPSGHPPDARDLDFISDLARQRAAAGFPLEAMLHAFRVGDRVLWDWLIGQVEDARKGEIALALTPFMHEYLGVVTRQLTETYVEAVQTSVGDADRQRRDLLEALLRGDAPGRIYSLAHALGLQADVQYVVIVATTGAAESEPGDGLLRRAEQVLCRRLHEAGAESFPILREDEIVLLVPWAADHRHILRAAVEPAVASLAQMYGARLVAGGSMACDGLAEVRLGYQEARLALERASATGAFVALADATFFESLLALGAPAVQRRLPAWARDLIAEGAPEPNELIRTVLAYVAADLSIERTARALFVHPNTVRYRLRRLAKLTGMDLGCFYDLIELITVVRLLPASQGKPRDSSYAPARTGPQLPGGSPEVAA